MLLFHSRRLVFLILQVFLFLPCRTVFLLFHLLSSLYFFYALFLYFILFFYSSAKYVLSTHCTPKCDSIENSRAYFVFLLLLLRTYSILRIFMNIISTMHIQHAPNTHPWLIPSHSGLLCYTFPCLHQILEGLPDCLYLFCHFFLFTQNFLHGLCYPSCEIILNILHCLLHSDLCSVQIPYHTECFVP